MKVGVIAQPPFVLSECFLNGMNDSLIRFRPKCTKGHYGASIEATKMLEKLSGEVFEYHETNWKKFSKQLQKYELDTIAPQVSANPSRAENFSFCNPVFAEQSLCFSYCFEEKSTEFDFLEMIDGICAIVFLLIMLFCLFAFTMSFMFQGNSMQMAISLGFDCIASSFIKQNCYSAKRSSKSFEILKLLCPLLSISRRLSLVRMSVSERDG